MRSGGALKLPRRPSIRPERDFARSLGGLMVAGIDEAGRGPLAGPVVAAAVAWDFEAKRPPGITDSKLLPERTRTRLAAAIRRRALAWGVGVVHAAEIDLLNILEATRLASQRALDDASAMLATRTGSRIGAIVTDALEVPSALLPTLPLIKGDRRSASVAAASILAKTSRDAMMDLYHAEFPEYGWDRNRGYPTADHRAALERLGPTVLHRMSFGGVGFFHVTLRRSRTFDRLQALIEATPRSPDAVLSLGELIEEAAERLPPPDLTLLREQLAARQDQGVL